MSDDVRLLIQGVCVLMLVLLSEHAYRNARGSLYMYAMFTITTIGTLFFLLRCSAYMIG